jgi:Uma2 family endonuclease
MPARSTAAAVATPDPPVMTLEAWADMDEDDPGELVDGRLVEEEVPSILHEGAVSWLIAALRAWMIARGGRVFGSELKLSIAVGKGRKPDVSVYGPGARLPSRKGTQTTRPPTIAIEVISPRPRDAHRDRVEKVHEYSQFGITWYWLLDPQLRVLEILELGADRRYTIALSASFGVHPVPGFEGFLLDIDALWAEVDALPDEDEEQADDGAEPSNRSS